MFSALLLNMLKVEGLPHKQVFPFEGKKKVSMLESEGRFEKK